MPAPDNIKDLVKHFEEHREVYRLGKYNETQLPGSASNVHHPLLQANEKDVFGELEKNENENSNRQKQMVKESRQ